MSSVWTVDRDRLRESVRGPCRDSTVELGFLSLVPPSAATGDGEVGVIGRSSRGESGEKLGKDVSDLSDSAIEAAELEGCEVSFALFLLLDPAVVDLSDLLERTETCETDRSSSSGFVEASASILTSLAEHLFLIVSE